MSAAFPPRSLGAPSSRLIARRENSAAALRSLAGSAGGLLASAGPLWALPSLLAPSALLRRASSLVGKTAPRRCARWPAPPAACCRAG